MYCSAHDEWLIMKLCMYVRYHTANNVSKFGGDPITFQVIMRKRSTVLIHIFSQIHSKQRFRLNIYMYTQYIRSLLSKTCSSGIVFGKFNQIYPCTINDF